MLDIRYKCSSCRRVFDSPKWLEKENYKLGLCPNCGDEVARKMKSER